MDRNFKYICGAVSCLKLLFLSACILFSCANGNAKSASGISVDELTREIITSEREIKDVMLKMKVYEPQRDNKLFYEHEWGYDRGREFYSGTRFSLTPLDELRKMGVSDRTEDNVIFDGEKQYTLRLQEGGFPSGSIRAFDAASFRGIMTPTTLLGFDARELSRQSLGEALLGAESLSSRDDMEVIDGHLCYVVEAINVEMDPVVKWTYDVRVWIDPKRGYRPLKFEKHYGFGGDNRWKVLSRLVDNIKLEKIDGVWFPVEGTRTTYTKGRLSRPENMSQEQWDSLTALERHQTGVFDNKPMLNTRLLKVKINSINLNKGIPEDRFEMKFPINCVVWDEFTQMGYTVGGTKGVLNDALDFGNDGELLGSDVSVRHTSNENSSFGSEISQDNKNILVSNPESDVAESSSPKRDAKLSKTVLRTIGIIVIAIILSTVLFGLVRKKT